MNVQYSKDMTKGPPRRLLLMFAAPVVAANVLQQLYSVVDSAVIGQLLGTESFAAVGVGAGLYWVVLNVIMGLASGFAVLVARRFGAGDERGTQDALASSAWLMAISAVLLSVLGVLLARRILALVNTPLNIINGAVEYLRFLFAGLVVTAAYNLAASVLRAFGDGKSPLVAMVIASLLNLLMDILFVSVFHWEVRGAAVATLLAQCVASAYCLVALLKIHAARVPRKLRRLKRETASDLLQLGLPLAVRYFIIGIGSAIFQYVINSFGYLFVAGMAAAKRLAEMAEQIGAGLDSAVRTFASQNAGAENLPRVRAGVKSALRIAVITGLLLAAFMFFFGDSLLSIFITDAANSEGIAEALAFGHGYLRIFSAALCMLYAVQILRAALEGIGDTVTPMLTGVVEFTVRIFGVLVLPILLGVWGVYVAEPIGWLVAVVMLGVVYRMRTQNLLI